MNGMEAEASNKIGTSQLINQEFGLYPDKGVSGSFATLRQVTPQQLRALYEGGSPLARLIVNLPVDDAVRHWVTVTHDDSQVVDIINEFFTKFDIQKLMRETFYESAIYGGSVIIPIYNSYISRSVYNEKLSMQDIKSGIANFMHLDRFYAMKMVTQMYDPLKEDFLEPDNYNIAFGGGPLDPSRLIPINGEFSTLALKGMHNYFGMGTLQINMDTINRIETLMRIATEVSVKSSVVYRKVGSLAPLLASKGINFTDFYSKVKTMLDQGVLDAEDDVFTVNQSTGDTVNCINLLFEVLSGSTQMPLDKFKGGYTSSHEMSGSAGTVSSSEKNYHSKVKSIQEHQMAPVLRKVIRVGLLDHYGTYDKAVAAFDGMDFEWAQPKYDDIEQEVSIKKDRMDSLMQLLDRGYINPKMFKTICINEDLIAKEDWGSYVPIAPDLIDELPDEAANPDGDNKSELDV